MKRWYFFPENMIFFHRAESERRPFPGNKWKHDASPSEEKPKKKKNCFCRAKTFKCRDR